MEFELVSGKLRAYSKVGGYPLFYLDGEDAILCAACATDSLDDEVAKYRPMGIGVNWENWMTCDRCDGVLDAAYGVVDEEE